jgi:hypothetical protein
MQFLLQIKENLAKNSESQQKQLIENLQKERSQLNSLLIKQKNFSKIKLFTISNEFNKEITELTENSDKIKRRETDHMLMSEQRQLLIHQQKVSLKKQLSKLDVEYNNLKMKFEKELKEKQIKEHELQQKMKNEKNLNSAKQSNVDKLVSIHINVKKTKCVIFYEKNSILAGRIRR